MRAALALGPAAILWTVLAVLLGHYLGDLGGYRRGVRDAYGLVMQLQPAPAQDLLPPEPFTKGEI